MTLLAQAFSNFNSMANAVQRIVSVDEKNAVVGHRSRVGIEGFQLAFERHYPAVRESPRNRNSVQLSRQHVGCAGAAADISGPAGGKAAIHALGAAQTKFDHRLALRREADTRAFGGDEGLEVEEIQQRSF